MALPSGLRLFDWSQPSFLEQEAFDNAVRFSCFARPRRVWVVRSLLSRTPAAPGRRSRRATGGPARAQLLLQRSGNIRVRNSDRILLNDVAQVLMADPASGMIFPPGRDDVNGVIEGSFAQTLVRIACPERSATWAIACAMTSVPGGVSEVRWSAAYLDFRLELLADEMCGHLYFRHGGRSD